MLRSRLVQIAAAAAAAAAAALVLILSAVGGEAGTPTRTVAEDPVTGESTTGTAPSRPTISALPRRLAGFRFGRTALTSYRLSLVFRLRNSIANGLERPASDYGFETGQAHRGPDTAVMIGIAPATGAEPPDIADNVHRLVGTQPIQRLAVRGSKIRLYRAPGYVLALVGSAGNRAVVVLTVKRRMALDVARAVAFARGRAPAP